MTTYVLVHGSWHGGWCWRETARALRSGGHEVFAPTLSGCAERFHHCADKVTLSTHVKDIVDMMFFEDLHDVVLVAHSYAGMVAQGVCNAAPGRLSGIVYLDAYVVTPGQKGYDLWTAERRAEAAESVAQGYPYRQPFDPSFLGIEDPRQADQVRERLTPHPLATYDHVMDSESVLAAQVPRVYVACTVGPLAPIFGPIVSRVRQLGWPVETMSAPHDAMLTNPSELSALLVSSGNRFKSGKNYPETIDNIHRGDSHESAK